MQKPPDKSSDQSANKSADKSGPPSRYGWDAYAVIDWVFRAGRLIDDENEFIDQLARQMVDAGAPVDRFSSILLTLHPQVIASANTWERSQNKTTQQLPNHGVRNSERYIGSPLKQLFDTGKRVRQRLDRLPADAHLAFAELVPDGYIDYLAMPVYFGEVLGCGLIVVTKKATGFSKADIEGFRLLRTYLAPVLEVYALRYQMHSLLDTYVGRRTGEKILSGMVKRGDADSIFSALWFSDLREFTHLSEILSTDKMLTLLNQYFEIVSASVTAQGGEILRFIGDAMLIVFPIDEKVTRKQACQAAINAALDAQSTLATLNHQRRRHGEPEIHFGVGLNIGEVIYGNVGALDRLDFTVMGRAVNRTARFESLTKTLDRNILFSREFAELIDAPTCFMGEHQLKGIANPQAVYALQPQAVNDIPEESGANH